MGRLLSTTIGTPIGRLTIVATEAGVVATFFDDEDAAASLEDLERRLGSGIGDSSQALGGIRREIEGYLDGSLQELQTPVDLRLIDEGFGRRVLEATVRIPFGDLWTYGDVAATAGSPRGGRAAGNALSRCPIELFVPCHRVVHAAGTIGGYGRHEDRKRWLLRHEGHEDAMSTSSQTGTSERSESRNKKRIGR